MAQLNSAILALYITEPLHITPLLGSKSEIRLMPNTLESNSRMKCRQGNSRNCNHSALEHHEHRLITRKELRVEAPRKLCTPIDTPHEDSDGGDEETKQETFEEAGVDDIDVLDVPFGLVLPDAESEVAATSGENAEGDNLGDETCQHDVAA